MTRIVVSLAFAAALPPVPAGVPGLRRRVAPPSSPARA